MWADPTEIKYFENTNKEDKDVEEIFIVDLSHKSSNQFFVEKSNTVNHGNKKHENKGRSLQNMNDFFPDRNKGRGMT